MYIRIAVAGCRNYKNYENFKSSMNKYLEELQVTNIIILSGHCSGTDEMAERYANEKGLQTELFPAEWNKYGKAAGPIRNRTIAEKADFIIVFWDGKSKGTKSMVDLASKFSKPITILPI